MDERDKQDVRKSVGEEWLDYILHVMLRERVVGLLSGIVIGWCVLVLVIGLVFEGHGVEIPGYGLVVSGAILGLLVLETVWDIARLRNR